MKKKSFKLYLKDKMTQQEMPVGKNESKTMYSSKGKTIEQEINELKQQLSFAKQEQKDIQRRYNSDLSLINTQDWMEYRESAREVQQRIENLQSRIAAKKYEYERDLLKDNKSDKFAKDKKKKVVIKRKGLKISFVVSDDFDDLIFDLEYLE